MKTLIVSALMVFFSLGSVMASEVSEGNSGEQETIRIVREVR